MPETPRPEEPSATRRPIERLFEVYATSVDARDGDVLRRLKAALSKPAPAPEGPADRTEADHPTS